MALKVVVLGLIVTGVVVASLLFIPLPGYYNVEVTVDSWTVSAFVVNDYGISSVSPQVTGQSTILDAGVLGGIGGPALEATFTMTVCVGSHCASKSAAEWFPTVPVLNGGHLTVSNSFNIGYVPTGTYTVTAQLTQSGNDVADGSSSGFVVGG